MKPFDTRAGKLERVDAVVMNGSIATERFELREGNESTVTVNLVSTMLLVLLLLPGLRESAGKWGTVPVVTVVSSDMHFWTKFPERRAESILATLNGKEKAGMRDRCATTCLL